MSATIRKKVAPQIRDLAERNVALKERSMYVVVGDNGRDQVVNLHYMLSKLSGRKPNVLWCYKKELGFSSHSKKRTKEVKKNLKTGLHDTNLDDPFDMFQKTNDIRYCFYRDSEQVLGKTFSMCVLQDFEALTPNILCRTIETVEGGGMIVILLRTMSSLKQLYSVAMDMHKKYRNDEPQSNAGLEPRFNERFILSLGNCNNCIVMDDEMNILPISTSTLKSLAEGKDSASTLLDEVATRHEVEKSEISQVSKMAENIKPVGDIVIGMSKTSDQAKAVLQFTQTLNSASTASSTSSIRRLVCLTSGRGRGKSAALGMAIGSAVAFGYSNIVVTAPSSDNVTTVFEFISKTLEALGFRPHTDYVELSRKLDSGSETSQSIYSTQKGNRQMREVPNQIIINKNNHRQCIQFVPANDCHSVLGSAEILVIDEAAAIPLPVVKNLINSGNHLTLMSSTVHGYEGTGRALSLKLIQEIKRNSSFVVSELEMKMPIRYCLNDGIEKWLHGLLCLDSTEAPALKNKLVSPNDCKLYVVNRDALFSHHKATERFLRSIVSLFVSSHYKNSPDDLMLMSDAPKHHVLALIPPVSEEDSQVPEVYVAIQIALEGRIGSQDELFNKTASGLRPSGDMIPWTLSQQFSDTDFGQLNGVRIVRIAVHPNLPRMGYGTEAIKQLCKWVNEISVSLPVNMGVSLSSVADPQEESKSLQTETLKPRKLKKPLLSSVDDSEAAQIILSGTSRSVIDFVGTSFGLTINLFNFWRKNGFVPLYLRQTQNDTTGEFTCMMLRASDTEWLASLYTDFSMRFQRLLSGPFKTLSAELALSVISCNSENRPVDPNIDILQFMSTYDLKRLRAYARGECDYHLITDLVPVVADLIFNNKISITGSVSFLARRVLVGMGSQRKSIDEIYQEDKARISIPQILGIFKPTMDKISAQIEKKLENKIKSQINDRKNKNLVLPNTVPTPTGRAEIGTSLDQVEPPTLDIASKSADAPEKKKHKGDHTHNFSNKKKHKVHNQA